MNEHASRAPSAPPLVRLQGLKKTYDGTSFVVDNLDLEIHRGEFLTLLGPSGSGKTTTLMMLAGFEQPTAGDIFLNGKPINALPPHRRDFGMVFQNYSLFPHLTVAGNVGFPLSVRKLDRQTIERRVGRALDMVQLAGLDRRYPQQLSGGQQQRVALARALVFEPSLVLMDEPLGALDKRLRERMQLEIKSLHRELGLTIVYVTHDQVEAMVLSDRVAVFHRGRIQQLDTPRAVHEQPVNGFVAQFLGETNSATGTVESVVDGLVGLRLDGGLAMVGVSPQPARPGERKLITIRPERVRIDATPPCDNSFAATVRETAYLGDRVNAVVELASGLRMTADLGIDGLDRVPVPGQRVTLGWSHAHCLVLPPD